MIKPRVLHSVIKINPKEGLETAILKVAAEDHKEALIKQATEMEPLKTQKEVRKLERFFLGPWGQLLSNNLGELIIEKCKQEVHNEI